MRLYDNTRLSDFKRCPRLFFFRHVLNWNPKGTKAPLVFGSAWHSAMEVVWGNLAKIEKDKQGVVKAAYAAFLKTWQDEGMDFPLSYEQEKDLSPRTPGRAFEMIAAYVAERSGRFSDFEILAIEQPFIVPLDPNDSELFYVGKIDKIVRYRSKILGIEHKTSTAYAKSGGFRTLFLESFSPNSQVDGYQYALHMLYPDGLAGGVWVDAALVHKEHEAFQFIPVEKQLKYLDSWLWDTKSWISRVEDEKANLCLQTDLDDYMAAFPKNTNSCWDFNSACAYHGICRAWANPLGRSIPEEYVEEKWDPLDQVKGLKELLSETSDNQGASSGGSPASGRYEAP